MNQPSINPSKPKFALFFVVGLLLLGPCTTNQSWKTTSAHYSTPIPYLPTIFEEEAIEKVSQHRFDDPRPNIILILTDDQPYHTVQYMPTVRDVLMKKGVIFENGYVTTPLCCPSRASILSGQYAHNHQVYTNRMPLGGAEKFDDSKSFAIWLQAAGYQTAYFGKYLNGYEDITPIGYVPPGWTEWNAFLSNKVMEDEANSQYFLNFSMSANGVTIKYPESKNNFSADVLTRQAISFIRDSQEMPFFMFVAYYNPHAPYLWAERHDDQFRGHSDLQAVPYRPPNFMEEDVSDKPLYLQTLHHLPVRKIDESYKQILRSLLSVDDGIASILNVLEQTGLSKNTIIVYLSDNGLTVGNHGLGLAKNCPYDECIRVPFIVYAPDLFDARTDSHLVANIDIAPTFAELAGVWTPDYVDGKSLLLLLNNNDAAWRDALLIEHWPTEEGVGSKIPEFYAIRTMEWKYVEYSTGETELFDLKNDPYELENLASFAAYTNIKAELEVRLDELKKE
jgi:N-acetylglucosamine-6-sulfatase